MAVVVVDCIFQHCIYKYSLCNAILPAFSAFTLLVGRQEGHPACEN